MGDPKQEKEYKYNGGSKYQICKCCRKKMKSTLSPRQVYCKNCREHIRKLKEEKTKISRKWYRKYKRYKEKYEELKDAKEEKN